MSKAFTVTNSTFELDGCEICFTPGCVSNVEVTYNHNIALGGKKFHNNLSCWMEFLAKEYWPHTLGNEEFNLN